MSIQLKIEQKNHQKKRNFNSVDEEDQIKTDLNYKSRSMFKNQLPKLNLHSNAHNSAYTTRNRTKLPQIIKAFQQ